MTRLPRYAALALALLAFAAISALLARALSAGGAQREAIEKALRAQQPGAQIEIVRLDPSTQFALGPGTTTVRVVWKTPDTLTAVQCATVRRDGNVVAGFDVHVRRLSHRIGRESSCDR